jgi:hypothetical protein
MSLQTLQEMAQAGFHATAQIVTEQFHAARQATNDRVGIARGGKQILNEGGEVVVLGKKASVDAASLDRTIASRVQDAIFRHEESVAKLKSVRSARHAEDSFGNDGFCHLAAPEHEARATAYRQIARILEQPTSFAEMSPEEFDALAIVQAKMGCATMMTRTTDGLETIRQKALTSMSSGSASQAADDGRAPDVEAAAGQGPTLLQGLHNRAHSGLQKLRQTANDRIETAKAGKRLLDDGGESVAQVVVAKKACLDAAEVDSDIAQKVQSAVFLFVDSAAKLRAVPAGQKVNGSCNLSQLAEAHEKRASIYRQIAEMLEAPTIPVEMNLSEWDALSIVKVKDGLSSLHCRTNDSFDVVKVLAFSNCDSEMEGVRREYQRRTACA